MTFNLEDWLKRARNETLALWAKTVAFFARKDVHAGLVWIKEPLLSVAIVFAATTLIAQPFYVPSGSMQPTLAIGDAVLATKFNYGYNRYSIPLVNGPTPSGRFLGSLPKVGDVVVFRLPWKTSVTFVKRVVGLPGDTLELRHNTLILNGESVDYRPIADELLRDVSASDRASQIYADEQLPGRSHVVAAIPLAPARRDFGPTIVPEGCYFMMGDNRDNSFDSRYFGSVERQRIVGHATSVVLSFDHSRHWLPRWHRFFSAL